MWNKNQGHGCISASMAKGYLICDQNRYVLAGDTPTQMYKKQGQNVYKSEAIRKERDIPPK